MCDERCLIQHASDTVTGSKTSDINMKRTLKMCNATASNVPLEGAFWCTEIEAMHPTTFFISRSLMMISWSALYILSRTDTFAGKHMNTIWDSNRWQVAASFLTTVSSMVHTQAFFVDYGLFDAVSRDSSPALMIPSGIEFVINIVFMVFFSSLRHVYATCSLVLTTAHFAFLTMYRMSISIWLILNMSLILLLLSCFIRVSEVHRRRGFLNRLRLRRNNLRDSLRIRPFSVRIVRWCSRVFVTIECVAVSRLRHRLTRHSLTLQAKSLEHQLSKHQVSEHQLSEHQLSKHQHQLSEHRYVISENGSQVMR